MTDQGNAIPTTISHDKTPEIHFTHRVGWLRAAVLGANDGIVSTASLIVGVAAAEASRSSVLVAGVAGLVAGAMSMAAGEYVSVSSQSDTERADLERERAELATDGENEHAELAAIYVARGLDAELAQTGGDAIDGQGRTGSARPRRARHLRHAKRAAGAGRVRVGGQFHRRCRSAALCWF